MIKDIHSAIAKGTRVLIVSAEDIVVFDRYESGRGHVWTPTLCLDLAEGWAICRRRSSRLTARKELGFSVACSGRCSMTELETRLADYRAQIEAKDAEIRARIAHEHALFESLRTCRRLMDEMLERLETTPRPAVRVRIWDKKNLRWWGGSIENATVLRSIGQWVVDKWPNDYELQPVVEKPPEEPVAPKRMRVVMELAKGAQPRKSEVGGTGAFYANQDVWVGTVVEIEEGK